MTAPEWDWRAVLLGAALAVAVAVPVAALAGLLDEDGSGPVIALGTAALAGFLAGGWLAGRQAAGPPLLHGAAAALLAAVVAQGVTAGIRLAGDDDISVATLVVNTVLATSLGLAGGWLADRRARTAGYAR